jgi:prepilin-type N-terminal cleavage/methylation domain-containing protein
MKKNKGFTLIELLVVIAIIGVLASVVLASLNTARAKGADAAIKSNLANLRAQAEMNYDSYGCYAASAVCSGTVPAVYTAAACAQTANTVFADSKFYAGVTAALTSSGGFGACSSTVGGGAWSAGVVLKTDTVGSTAWCVDSSGASKMIYAAGTAPSATAYTQALLNADIGAGVCGS